jgi:hypothetical protein
MGPIEPINQSLKALEQQATDLGEQLFKVYQGYLSAVGRSAQQQLVLAAYHICTDGYPERFLGRPMADREVLQRALQQLAKTLVEQLQTFPHPSAELPPPPPDPDLELLGERPAGTVILGPVTGPVTDSVTDSVTGPVTFMGSFTPSSRDDERDSADDEEDADDSDEESEDDYDGPDDDDRLPEGLAEALSTAFAHPGGFAASGLESKIRELLSVGIKAGRSASGPVAKLIAWQQSIERGAVAQLRTTSQAANQLLMKAEVVPNEVPAPVLEAASQAEGGDPFSKTPHIMTLVMEAGPGSGELMRVMAIKLRLGELEFHDPLVMTWRRQLQGLSKQLQALEQNYQKQLRAQSVAQAQAAWRSTWLTD